jgi:hypothetical protein
MRRSSKAASPLGHLPTPLNALAGTFFRFAAEESASAISGALWPDPRRVTAGL